MKRPSSLRPVGGLRRVLVVGAGVGAVALGLAACGNESTALEVDDTSISRADLTDQLEEWGALNQAATDAGVDAGLSAQWASWWVRFTALEDWAAGEGITVSEADLEAAQQPIAESFPGVPVEGNAALEQLVQWQALLNVLSQDEALLAAALEANPALTAPLLCSRHILVETEEEAEEILDLLEEGGDFAALAAERSVDTASGAQGGDLGCAPQGSFVPEFEEAAYAADEGEVVGPVETQFGFHVIEVLDLQEPTPEDLGPQLAQLVQGELIQGTSPLFTEVFEDRSVSVDGRYGTWDPTVFTVVPPSGPLPAPGQEDLGEPIEGS